MSTDVIFDKVQSKTLQEKITTAEDAATHIKEGMTLGCSGFTPSGYPKAVPLAFAERAKQEGPIPVTLWTGASTGPEPDHSISPRPWLLFPRAFRKKITITLCILDKSTG